MTFVDIALCVMDSLCVVRLTRNWGKTLREMSNIRPENTNPLNRKYFVNALEWESKHFFGYIRNRVSDFASDFLLLIPSFSFLLKKISVKSLFYEII